MTRDAADSAAAQGTRSGEKDMRIIGFRAPERLVAGVAVEEGEIKITVENVSARQRDVLFQVEGRFHLDRRRAVAAGREDGFDGIEQILVEAGDGAFHGQRLGALRIGVEEFRGRVQAEKGQCVETLRDKFRY